MSSSGPPAGSPTRPAAANTSPWERARSSSRLPPTAISLRSCSASTTMSLTQPKTCSRTVPVPCTTNCLAPMAKVLHAAFGVESGIMTTIHAYTNTSDQRLNDGLRRARAAALSTIPTSSGAASTVGRIISEFDGKLTSLSLRVPVPVPVPVGSITDLTAQPSRPATREEINEAFATGAETPGLSPCLAYSEAPLVSADVVGNPHSAIFDAPSPWSPATKSRSSPGTTTNGVSRIGSWSSLSGRSAVGLLADLLAEPQRLFTRSGCHPAGPVSTGLVGWGSVQHQLALGPPGGGGDPGSATGEELRRCWCAPPARSGRRPDLVAGRAVLWSLWWAAGGRLGPWGHAKPRTTRGPGGPCGSWRPRRAAAARAGGPRSCSPTGCERSACMSSVVGAASISAWTPTPHRSSRTPRPPVTLTRRWPEPLAPSGSAWALQQSVRGR